MTRAARQAIVSLVITITMFVSFVIAYPIAQRYSSAKAQAIASQAGKTADVRGAAVFGAIYPMLFTVFGCGFFALLVGYLVARRLPRSDKPSRRRR